MVIALRMRTILNTMASLDHDLLVSRFCPELSTWIRPPLLPCPPLQTKLLALLDEVLAHDGFGSVRVDVRLLKRGQKEVILDCGKQHRFVVDIPVLAPR